MKPSLIAYFVIVIVLINSTYETKLKTRVTVETNSLSQAEQSIFAKMWDTLFTIPRGKACSRSNLLARIRRELIEAGLYPGQRIKKKKFWWVKQWGYGPSAYFFDFIDPVLRNLIVNEFNTTYKDVMGFPQADSNIPDPFDYKKVVSQNSNNLSKQQIKAIRLFSKNFDQNIYTVSANLPQLQAAITKWKWNVNRGDPTYFRRFVMKYDMNFDGRLNPREFILASIWNNKQTIGSPLCEHCYFEVGKTLDAIFLYLDCNNDGLLSAEELWSNLPNIKRNTEKWNMFAFGNDESIRTASINDFILKNTKIKDGYITRAEFRVGILLGLWDRQTEKLNILSDDSRTLKNLRWEEGEMIDIALYNYHKKKMMAGLIK
jgi:hypothetical protein